MVNFFFSAPTIFPRISLKRMGTQSCQICQQPGHITVYSEKCTSYSEFWWLPEPLCAGGPSTSTASCVVSTSSYSKPFSDNLGYIRMFSYFIPCCSLHPAIAPSNDQQDPSFALLPECHHFLLSALS